MGARGTHRTAIASSAAQAETDLSMESAHDVNEGVLTTPAGGVGEIKAPGLEWGSHELVIEGQ
ncbi:MAG: hypothetical protein B7Z51_01350, partial [Methyloversatilis sp. 12-65-5]